MRLEDIIFEKVRKHGCSLAFSEGGVQTRHKGVVKFIGKLGSYAVPIPEFEIRKPMSYIRFLVYGNRNCIEYKIKGMHWTDVGHPEKIRELIDFYVRLK